MPHIILFMKGAAIGVATLIPGVSGGTMAILLGVYDLMINGISDFLQDWKKYLVPFIELGLGAVTGILLLSSLVSSLLKSYEIPMQFLFIGIILGGLPALIKKSRSMHHQSFDWSYLIVGIILVLLTASTPSALFFAGDSFSWITFALLFICGIVIAVALVLPGISASFLLLVLGMYQSTLTAIQNMDMLFLLPVGLGIVFGTFASAKVIRYFLENYPTKTYLLIIGFVAGSLYELLPSPQHLQASVMIPSILVMALGFLATLALSCSHKKEKS